ncbi:12026_t:CDS:1, partial [Acaulospora colombiana]
MMTEFFDHPRVPPKIRIEKLRRDCKDHEEKISKLRTFYSNFCKNEKVKDVQGYLDDLGKKSGELETVTLRQIKKQTYWTFHAKVFKATEISYRFSKSKAFLNIFETCIQNKKDKLTTESLATMLTEEVYKKFNELCSQYREWEKMKCSQGSILWNNVPKVDAELDIMGNFIQVENKEKLIKTLSYLSEVPVYIQRLQQLELVLDIFNVIKTNNSLLNNLTLVLRNDYLWLGRLVDYFGHFNKYFSEVDNASWELIKELSSAGEFIEFLRTIAEHDIKNMINGVEGTNERLIQEDTVSSLIQVKQFLLPLLNDAGRLTTKKFLSKLCAISKSNSSLSIRVKVCVNNSSSLKNMYRNISNKGEVTVEKIMNSVKRGTYTFQKNKDDSCTLCLTYPTLQGESCNLNLSDLQDLRGRALLITKPGASNELNIGQADEEQFSKDLTDEFVTQVDLAQEILIVTSKLIQMGHLGHRNFKETVKGTARMLELKNELEESLRQWIEKYDPVPISNLQR